MSVSATAENQHMLNFYQAYTLLEKEKNLFLLLSELLEKYPNNPEIIDYIQSILETANSSVLKDDRKTVLEKRTELLNNMPHNIGKDSELASVVRSLQETDRELNRLKRDDPELSEKIDEYRTAIRERDSLNKAFLALVPGAVGVAIGIADPTYISYVSSGKVGGDSSVPSAPPSPLMEQLNSIAQVLLSAHIVLIAQAIFGAVSLINFMRTELYAAAQVQKQMRKLDAGKTGIMLRLKKNALVIGLFFLRAVVLAISIGLTVAALTTPVGTAALLMVALGTYLFEEFRNLQIEKNILTELREEKAVLEAHVNAWTKEISTVGIPIDKRVKAVDRLQAEREKLGKKEAAILLLEEAVAKSTGKRNKTLYNAIGATLIILSVAFPPLFFIGLTMLVVPLVTGAARYVDERWNQGRITNAIINSALGQSVINSRLYKKVFGSKPAQREDKSHSNDFEVGANLPNENPEDSLLLKGKKQKPMTPELKQVRDVKNRTALEQDRPLDNNVKNKNNPAG